MLVGIAIVGVLAWLLVIGPGAVGGRWRSSRRWGTRRAPSVRSKSENLLECLGWGAIVGFAVGLARLLFSQPLAREHRREARLARPGAPRRSPGIVSLLLHVVAGAISGGVIGLLGLISPLRFLEGDWSILTTHAQPAVQLLMCAGSSTAAERRPGSAISPSSSSSCLVLVVVLTVATSMLACAFLGAAANAALTGAGERARRQARRASPLRDGPQGHDSSACSGWTTPGARTPGKSRR